MFKRTLHNPIYNKLLIFIGIALFFMSFCVIQSFSSQASALSQIKLPPGFHISDFASNTPNARSLALGDHGTVFVGTLEKGQVYALTPSKDFSHAVKMTIIASDLYMPNGVAFYNGDLYVAENQRILRFPDIENHLDHPPAPQIIYSKLPSNSHHGWRYIKFGPDGYLYITIGAPCNVCLSPQPIFASIARMKPDAGHLEIFAQGVRNSMGLAWDPKTAELWFTDNGRDWLGENSPPDKLNHASVAGLHFGFPYFHAKNLPDPVYGQQKPADLTLTYPAMPLAPHTAALGLVFYTGHMFPAEYQQQIFIAEHGSWNRVRKMGYRITLVKLKNNQVISYQPFATGWSQNEEAWGRPVDLLVLSDGSLLVSDDLAGKVYRISYSQLR